MLLITLEKSGIDCRVELDGQDVSQRLTGIEVYAEVNEPTRIVLTLMDDVTVMGEAGKLEFVKREDADGT